MFLLMVEVSDQYGTSKPVAIFSTRALADAAGEKIRQSRTWVYEIAIDPETNEMLRSLR